MSHIQRRFITLALFFGGIYLTVRYLLPLCLPFLLGAALALAADPIVRFLCTRARLPRPAAAGIGVSVSFAFLALVVMLLCGLLIRELGALSGVLPELIDAAKGGLDSLSAFLLDLAQRTPDGIRPLVTQQVTGLFSSGSALLDRLTAWLLALASGILSRIPDSAFGFFTAVLASFMISAKLPKLRETLRAKLPTQRIQPLLAAFTRLKTALLGWLKAQLKLSGVTFGLVAVGLLLLRVPYAPLWAVLVALVDSFPILGTGTVLIPWSLVSFLQGDHLRSFGLLGLYAGAVLTRTLLEPRLVGRQLGLDPLVTLIAFYAGFRLWGIPGMILAPLLAVTATQLTDLREDKL
ncbi:MAG: sporulation integral membrane protein YtvI [Oscillospiraceae bacterium]|nr:sporulation integral membrane protein YtvI [Oscillospiraceae bacterium]